MLDLARIRGCYVCNTSHNGDWVIFFDENEMPITGENGENRLNPSYFHDVQIFFEFAVGKTF